MQLNKQIVLQFLSSSDLEKAEHGCYSRVRNTSHWDQKSLKKHPDEGSSENLKTVVFRIKSKPNQLAT